MIARSRGYHSLFSPELTGEDATHIERKTGFLDFEPVPGLSSGALVLDAGSPFPLSGCTTTEETCSTDEETREERWEGGETGEEREVKEAEAEEEGCGSAPQSMEVVLTATEMARRETTRKLGLAMKELQDTEAAYIRRLELVCDLFIFPLRHKAPGLLPLATVHAMFHNVEAILRVSRLFLAHILVRRLAGADSHLRSMKDVYGEFATKFVSCSDMLAETTRSSAAFAQFRREQEKILEGRLGLRLGLSSLLLEPIQRVPRYELLFKQILKYAGELCERGLEAQATQCLGLAHEIALYVNKSSSNHEVELLQRTEARLTGPLAHIALGCSGAPRDEGFFLVKTIPSLSKITLASIHAFEDSERRWCVLFASVLVVARRTLPHCEVRATDCEDYVCEHLLRLGDVSVLQVDDKVISVRRRHSTAEPVLFLLMQSPEEAAAWLEKLRACA